MIKISSEVEDEEKVDFDKLDAAETFIMDGCYWIKLFEEGHPLALNLNTKEVKSIFNGRVIPVDMEVVAINKKTGEQTISEGSETK